MERHVQWYPGHMVQTTRAIREYLRSVDTVVEVVDARIPRSGRNPLLADLTGRQTHIVALNRDDLADPATTRRWLENLSGDNAAVLAVDGRKRGSTGRIAAMLSAWPSTTRAKKTSRAMILGVPNSGKSTIINALLKRSAAKTEDRAGVTRQMQWFRLAPNVELMDTPGVLPPKIHGAEAQWKIALCGAVPRTRYDPYDVAVAFHRWLVSRAPRTAVPDLERFAAGRGFRNRGGELDYHNAAQSYIRAFNDGAFGRISLEAPDDPETA